MVSNLDTQDKKIIVLTGLMGSGKTTIGSKLANRLGIYFIDSDQEIEDQEQKSINDIFKESGESYFRKVENKVIREIIERDEPMVLSLGGGAFMNKNLREIIKEKAITIWAYADLDTILRRIGAKGTRPLLNKSDKRQVLSNLILERYPVYREADIHINTDKDSYDNTDLIIAHKLKNFVNKSQLSTQRVPVNLGDKSYDIIIGNNISSNIDKYIKEIGSYSKVIVISDKNVANLHLDHLMGSLEKLSTPIKTIINPSGEQSKSFANLQNILEQILVENIDRNTLIIAFGGGVIGDLSGFAASILLRGIHFIQVPTTLLACVDSSVGGKTAINSQVGKNLIGSFYQPKLVLCDLNFLQTLPERDFLSGYAEAIKYGLIKDRSFFYFLQDNLFKIKARDEKILKQIIVRSCQIKSEIVSLDEKENGVRALLNFGHTFGHAFETETKYSNELFHGEAVAIGMVLAIEMSINLKIMESKFLPTFINHLKVMGLPTSPKDIRKSWKINNLISHLYKDKKVNDRNLTFILLKDLGSAVIQKNVDEKSFIEAVNCVNT